MRAPHMPVMVKGPLLAAGLLVLVGVLVSVLVLRALAATQERHLRELALLEFAGVEATVGPFVVRDDVWEMFDLLDRVTHRDGSMRPLSATLVDPLGRVIVSSAPDIHPLGAQRAAMIAAATPVTAERYDLADGAVSLSQVLEYQGRPLGKLVVDFDTTDFIAERERLVAILVIGNALATLIAALAGFAVIRRVLRPVARLTDAMGQSADGLQPIPEVAIPRRNPEIAQLYDTYNRLTHAVEERSRHVTPGAHALLVLGGAGWHISRGLVVPDNITLMPLPPYSPELNPIENLWQYLRQNTLANRVFDSSEDIVDVCCTAWNSLIAMPQRLASITRREWAQVKG